MMVDFVTVYKIRKRAFRNDSFVIDLFYLAFIYHLIQLWFSSHVGLNMKLLNARQMVLFISYSVID